MIPIKDVNPRRRFPIVNVTLIILNVVVFFFELQLGERIEKLFFLFGLIPAEVTTALATNSFSIAILLTFFTSLFLHGGWMHLLGNMLYLWVFGDNVEDKLGHFRYLIFYILSGIGASLLHVFIDPLSTIPTIGASGAIAGVLGAYMLLFPRARVITVIPIFIFLQVAELPAFLLIAFWFVIQFFNGLLSLGFQTAGMGGVAWWAHIGGFVVGIILAIPLRKYR